MFRTITLRPLLPILLISLLSPTAQAQSIEQQAEQLAQLRAEVEALSSELELEKEDLRGRLRALESQKVDLEVQIRREEMRLERLLAEEEKQKLLLEESAGIDDLTPVVRKGIETFRATVESGLPFKRDERLKALEDLENQLTEGSMSPEKAASRLWAFSQDERRLTRENALDRQVIPLNGEDILVDVARLGMIAMYFKTPDETYGMALPSSDGNGWTWTMLTNSGDSAQAEALFDALERGIRVGWFTLPQPLSGAR
ncbi:MAG: DUF3450 family protein [Myxococcota bacterium]